jgi:hypothetical protein
MREALQAFVKRVGELAEHVRGNEQATKQSLVGPLFTILGYDLTDPRECIPEYRVDFGPNRSIKPENRKPVLANAINSHASLWQGQNWSPPMAARIPKASTPSSGADLRRELDIAAGQGPHDLYAGQEAAFPPQVERQESRTPDPVTNLHADRERLE